MNERLERELREIGFRGVRSFDDIKARFISVAQQIMCLHRLVCGDYSWTITALELYLYTCRTSAIWHDPYTHVNAEQLESATWYVHDDGDRAPTYSGIDITCGSKNDGIYGGLLIRELCEERRWVFQRIVRGNRPNFPRKGNVWSGKEKELIRAIHKCGAGSGLLQLVSSPERKTQLYIGRRIGLQPKPDRPAENPDGVSFRLAPLRIATWKTAVNTTSMTEV
jgi:hypothetical protein